MAGDAELTHAEGDIGSATPKGSQTPQNHGDFPSTAPNILLFAGRNSELFRRGNKTLGIKKLRWQKRSTEAWNKPERLLFSRLGLHTLQLAASLE